jgi:predicted nucleic acid-binding protein
MTYYLDACALLAFLCNEEGSDVVDELLEQAEAGEITLKISAVNYAEVGYNLILGLGQEKALAKFADVDDMPIIIVYETNKFIINEVIRLKTTYQPRIPIADCFAIGSALSENATFVTADHGDMKKVEAAEHLSMVWVREKPYNS